MTTASRSQEIHRGLDHPIIDSDGHYIEFQPAVFDLLAQVGGTALVDRYRKWVAENSLFAWYDLSPQERVDHRVVRPPWWGLPMRDARDRAGGDDEGSRCRRGDAPPLRYSNGRERRPDR